MVLQVHSVILNHEGCCSAKEVFLQNVVISNRDGFVYKNSSRSFRLKTIRDL